VTSTDALATWARSAYLAAMLRNHLASALLLALLPLAPLQAQDVLDKVAKESCSCATDLDTTLNEEERNMQLGLCMLQSSMPYQKELKKKYGIDLNNIDKDGERFGQLLGMRLAVQCPEFVAMMANMSDDEEAVEEAASAPVLPTSSMEGALSTVKTGQFLTLVVRKEDGASVELLFLDHAEGIDQVLRRPDQGRGTTGTWTYVTQDLFDPVSRSYRPFYVVKGVEAKP
jgi:hypothetical protein